MAAVMVEVEEEEEEEGTRVRWRGGRKRERRRSRGAHASIKGTAGRAMEVGAVGPMEEPHTFHARPFLQVSDSSQRLELFRFFPVSSYQQWLAMFSWWFYLLCFK